MTKVCKQHKDKPALIYGECVGCELEHLRAELEKVKAERDAMYDAIGQARAVEVGDMYEVFGPDWEAIEKAAGFGEAAIMEEPK